MRAGIFRCFVCGRTVLAGAEVTPVQPLPHPITWKFTTTWLQNNETGILVQLNVPLCAACPGISDQFQAMALAALTFFISGAVVQSAPCRPVVSGSSGSGPGSGSLPS